MAPPDKSPPLADQLQRAGKLLEAKQPAAALELLNALEKEHPPHPGISFRRGQAFIQKGELGQAEACLREALTLRPAFPSALHALANLLRRMERYRDARPLLHQLIEVAPHQLTAYISLSQLNWELREYAAAIAAARAALQIEPASAQANFSLGNAYFSTGHHEKAADCYEQTLAKLPEHQTAASNLAKVHLKLGNTAAALAAHERLLEQSPDDKALQKTVSSLYREQGRFEDAHQVYERPLSRASTPPITYWRALRTLPSIYRSQEEIIDWRSRFESRLATLEDNLEQTLQVAAREHEQAALLATNFHLTYQAQNDLPLQVLYGQMLQQVAQANHPHWMEPPRSKKGARVRVGFASYHWFGHTISKLFSGWFQFANRQSIECFVYYLGDVKDNANRLIAEWAEHYRHLPGGSIEQIGQTLRDDQLDVLIYPDLGMDPYTLYLATMRFAPIQSASWGHPTTSGLASIDYFLSSELMEPPQAEEHYSEQLIQLPNLSIAFRKPARGNQAKSREDFGLQDTDVVYLCCQYLSKYLPQYDDVFPKIAAQVPSARFVFVEHKNPAVTRILQTRLATAFDEQGLPYSRHCHFLSRLPPDDYLRLNELADVYLDSIAWSGGNTSLEALAFGLPVVTLPGKFMRGRHTCAMLRQLDMSFGIAEDEAGYVANAVKLGQEPELRSQLRREIFEKKPLLFEDRRPITALEELLREWHVRP